MENLTAKLKKYKKFEQAAAFNATLSAFKARGNWTNGEMAEMSGLGNTFHNIVAGRQSTLINHINAMEDQLPSFKELFFSNLFASEPGAALTVPIPVKERELESVTKLIGMVMELKQEIGILKGEVEKLKSGK